MKSLLVILVLLGSFSVFAVGEEQGVVGDSVMCQEEAGKTPASVVEGEESSNADAQTL